MSHILPWVKNSTPLMLAPMQGLTNVAMRQLFIDLVRPDVVFTELLPVRPGSKRGLSSSDCSEITNQPTSTPLVVQLMGRDVDALVKAAEMAEQAGAQHVNINMGCPYGRMINNSAGGALLREPERLPPTLKALRAAIKGSFSVKLRSGYSVSSEVYGLLPLFEDAGVDFLILHPRTVEQRYNGPADHSVTQKVCELTSLPVIANGDINCAADGQRLLEDSGVVGLMMGRGAIADPWLFARLRGELATSSDEVQRRKEVREYLLMLQLRYQQLFCGDTQVLSKLKEVLNQIHDEWFQGPLKALRKCKRLDQFALLLHEI